MDNRIFEPVNLDTPAYTLQPKLQLLLTRAANRIGSSTIDEMLDCLIANCPMDTVEMIAAQQELIDKREEAITFVKRLTHKIP